MKKNFKRALSAALVVVMLFTAFPAAFAFGSKETDYTIISPYEQVDWANGKIYKQNPPPPSAPTAGARPSAGVSGDNNKGAMDTLP